MDYLCSQTLELIEEEVKLGYFFFKVGRKYIWSREHFREGLLRGGDTFFPVGLFRDDLGLSGHLKYT